MKNVVREKSFFPLLVVLFLSFFSVIRKKMSMQKKI